MVSLSSYTRWLVVLTSTMLFTSPLAAQEVPQAASIERVAPPLPPLRAALSPPIAHDVPPLNLTVKERPVWLFPVIGAAAGALIGLAIPDGCDDHDCTLSVPPPLLGAVYGGVIGLVIEFAL